VLKGQTVLQVPLEQQVRQEVLEFREYKVQQVPLELQGPQEKLALKAYKEWLAQLEPRE
jgi:hypothetical protein